jgi:hypothetical protein
VVTPPERHEVERNLVMNTIGIIGAIAIGDQTNDANVDGAMRITGVLTAGKRPDF